LLPLEREYWKPEFRPLHFHVLWDSTSLARGHEEYSHIAMISATLNHWFCCFYSRNKGVKAVFCLKFAFTHNRLLVNLLQARISLSWMPNPSKTELAAIITLARIPIRQLGYYIKRKTLESDPGPCGLQV
jgi:hypothetical protein